MRPAARWSPNWGSRTASGSWGSRAGSDRWPGSAPPPTSWIVAAAEAKRPILLVPFAFVSEHSETLVELDIEYRKLATEQGAGIYSRVPAVGTHPDFVAGLAAAWLRHEKWAPALHRIGSRGSSAAKRAVPDTRRQIRMKTRDA